MCDQKCLFLEEGVCDGDMVALSTFQDQQIQFKCFPGATSLIEVLLLGDDRFYQHRIPLHKTLICSIHTQELLKQYWPSAYRKCWLCHSLNRPAPHLSERNINAGQALTIYEQLHIHHSYGKTICSGCRHWLSRQANIDKIENHIKCFEWINNDDDSDRESIDDNFDDNYEPVDLNSPVHNDIEPTTNTDNKKRQLLNEFLQLCGSNKKIKLTGSYSTLQKQSKANFLLSARNLIKHVLEFLAPNDFIDVQQDLFIYEDNKSNGIVYDRQFVSVMRGITEAYENAEHWATRRSILSIVAPKINFYVLQSFIPGITYYRFLAARMHAAQEGTGAIIKQLPRVICRFEQAQVNHFIDFITSNYVCTDVPFGMKTLILSDGTKLQVPDTVRNCNSSRIINQYYTYTKELFPELTVLHESTLFKILNGCKASTRKAINGLNYVAANGSEAFDNLFTLINQLYLDKGEYQRLTNNLKQGKQYLKTDFKVNVARTSRVRDHCISHALSDPSSNSFSTTCLDHPHDQLCSECTYLSQTLEDIRHAIKNSEDNEEEQKRNMYKFTIAYNSIQSWKSHQLRTINQDLGRECIMDIMGEDAIYLNLDFAMKWLPAKYREAQNDFFGKRGITWHITVASRRNKSTLTNIDMIDDVEQSDSNAFSDYEDVIDNDEQEDNSNNRSSKTDLNNFEHTVFVHVIDQCTQDSKLVVAIITDVLKRLKDHDPSIAQACIRSDNAACYHSCATILSTPTISEMTGVSIRRLDFADPQGGKGSCDRFAAVIKSHVRRYLNEKHDVIDAEQFVKACSSYGGIKNVNVVECRFMPSYQSAKFQFTNINKLRNFCYERHGIRVFRAWDIGEGVILPYNKLIHGKVTIDLLELIQPSSTINFGSSDSKHPSTEKDSSFNVDCVESSKNQTYLFECPEEACVCSFMKYGNLLRHLVLGNHRKVPEKTTLLDTAKKLYHSKLELAENKKVISLSLNQVTFQSDNYGHLPQLNMGWALPVVHPPVRFTVKQKQFLHEKFNDGFLYGRFWKPEQIVDQMQRVKTDEGNYIFDINEWLTTGQIRSYFSRLRSSTSKKIDQMSFSGGSKRVAFINTQHDEEQNLDDEADAEESFKDNAAVEEALERIALMKEISQVAERQ